MNGCSWPLIAAVLTCSKQCAPALLQRICCFLHIRQLISWFTVDSTCAVDTRFCCRKAFAYPRTADSLA
jgi:hypothetical protein